MTIINGYATRAELLRELMTVEDSAAPNVVDDDAIDNIITDASRDVDAHCARQFYATAETLYLSVPSPYDRQLWFGRDVLAVQGASNGDGGSIAASNYYLWPRNANSFAAIMLKESATVNWSAASSGDTEGVIAVAASVGYVNRAASAASDPAAGLRILAATHRGTLLRAMQLYRQRHPTSVEERVIKDADWQAPLEGYVRHVY